GRLRARGRARGIRVVHRAGLVHAHLVGEGRERRLVEAFVDHEVHVVAGGQVVNVGGEAGGGFRPLQGPPEQAAGVPADVRPRGRGAEPLPGVCGAVQTVDDLQPQARGGAGPDAPGVGQDLKAIRAQEAAGGDNVPERVREIADADRVVDGTGKADV